MGFAVFRAMVIAALTLAGCAGAPVVAPPPLPVRLPPEMAPPPVAPPVNPASAAAVAYYAQVQQSLLSQGLLRTDPGGPETPYTDRMLAETFLQLAMYDEYAPGSGGLKPGQTANVLRRWSGPVRVGLSFGASVPAETQATDRARVGSYLARLARVTGHPIRLDDANPNFFVHIVSDDERRNLGGMASASLGGLSAADMGSITNMPQSTYCSVLAVSEGRSGVYRRAFAVVRAEHPDLLRLSCLHEEIAQGLGLPNDSPRARPSIFNDDEEFALLTRMDEQLLQILYNPALRPGMTEAEVRPIVFDLAARMVGGAS
jgi:hypothetical protein